jgi:rhodanese-related sulfurtransferase
MGHLPSALNIPLGQLERRLAELPSNRDIVAYWRGPWCVLSFEAVALLRNKGYRARRLEDALPGMENGRAPGQLDAVTGTLADLPTAKEACGNERGKRQI